MEKISGKYVRQENIDCWVSPDAKWNPENKPSDRKM
jgi:hypothetical protein